MENEKLNPISATLPALFTSVAVFSTAFLLSLFRDRAAGLPLLCGKLFSDAAATTGFGFLSAHLFSFIRRNGGFTAVSYAFAFVKNALFAPAKKQEHYAKYREKSKKGNQKSPACIWLIGLCYLLFSFLFI